MLQDAHNACRRLRILNVAAFLDVVSDRSTGEAGNCIRNLLPTGRAAAGPVKLLQARSDIGAVPRLSFYLIDHGRCPSQLFIKDYY
jgi:hypothetical protein